ncbi:MAG: immunoglobulin domain-containing protein, partial [Proteobacteria bacterium]|nr:immunoglobulin domain-containing protein [Pseudomonadota bacterium]
MLYRKSRDAVSWGASATLAANATNYVDTSVVVGSNYEYRILISTASYSSYGYIYTGIETPLVESRGKVILLVDNTQAASLAYELMRLQQDLVGDGWTVLRHDVSRTASVTNIKAIITADYNADTNNVKSVFIFGRVPVPYSGSINPDGHYYRAFPADVYYGELTSAWTDTQTLTGNNPGDGKFDQSTLPSDMELQVGRVDLANMPAFAKEETELLRQYLNKDHNFRHKIITAEPRGLMDDNFGVFGGESFASTGWRDFATFFGASNTFERDWLTTLATNSYLWGYGCGGGTASSCGGVGTTAQFATNDPRVVFTEFLGSYFGNWDTQNNFMRAALGTPSYTLTCAWAGRPYWFFHHMAQGEPIGFSTRLSQNNSGLYSANWGYRYVDIALMGDPTLRLHPVASPTELTATTIGPAVSLEWIASADAGLPGFLGYHVYRAVTIDGPWTRLTTDAIAVTQYSDAAPPTSAVYIVRALCLQTASSGSYKNLSQGAFVAEPNTPPTISGIADLVTDEDTASGTSSFTIGDAETSADALWITATASNAALVKNFVFAGAGAARTISVVPVTNANGSSVITVTVSDGFASASTNFTLTVNPVNDPPVPANLTLIVTNNRPATVTLSATDVENDPLSYALVTSPTNGTLTGVPPSLTYTDTNSPFATDSFRYTAFDGIAFRTGTVTLTIRYMAAITTDPQSLTNNPGTVASFMVSASGTAPLYYQWQKNTVNIGSATNATYTIPSVAFGHAGNYRCLVNNMVNSATSAVATLTVNGPAITANPQSLTNNPGTVASFTVTATGTALCYQWQKEAVNIGSATNATYTIGSVAAGDAGNYRCIVSDVEYAVTSTVATLTVNVPVAITIQPVSQTKTVGDSVSFTVVATGTAPLNYQWQKDTVNIGSATSATCTIPAAAADDAGNYRCLVSNMVNAVTSDVATLTVNTPVAITIQPVSQTNNPGSSASFTVSASGTAPLNYQWQKEASDISMATNATYTIPSVAAGDMGNYRCIVSNMVNAVTSAPATLSVDGPVTITIQPVSQTNAVSSTAGFMVSAAGTAPLYYQWQKNLVNIGSATTATYTIGSVAFGDAGNYRCIVSNVLNAATSAVATLTVIKADQMITFPASLAQAVTSTVHLSATASSGLAVTNFTVVAGPGAITGLTNLTFSGTGIVAIVAAQAGDANWNAAPNVTNTINVVYRADWGMVAGGGYHSTALKLDSTVWSWGYNSYGQLGIGNFTSTNIPVRVAILTNMAVIADGSYHSLAVKGDGTVWAWGYNWYGQLGDGTTTQTNTPVQTVGLSNITTVEAGSYHSLALKGDGTVWAWGANWYGQLGDGTTTPTNTPVQTIGLSNITTVEAGSYHSLALKGDGTVWAWGYNWYGQLGDGTTTQTNVPVQTVGLSNITMVEAGSYHSLALKGDGTVWAWGYNRNGQLGDGTTMQTNTPVQTVGLSNITMVEAGSYHSLALKGDGTVWAWGYNGYGQLGDGTTTSTSMPVQVSGLSNVVAIAAGSEHSLAIKIDGTVWAWGRNDYGQLGDGTTTPTNVPVQVYGFSMGTPNLPPVVNITSPSNGTWFTTPVNITISADASDSDGTVAKVEFYQGATKLGEATAEPYGITWSNVAGGSYSLTAKATDNFGASMTSSEVGIMVNEAPAITIQPVSQTNAVSSTADFMVSATGTAPLYYQWQKDTVNIGSATTMTYTIGSVAFSDAGSYRCLVSNVVNAATSDVATLTVSKADQTITFPAIPDQMVTNTVHLSATASSGLTVTNFALVSGPGVL